MNEFIAVFNNAETVPGALKGEPSDLIRDTLKLSDTVFVIRSPVSAPAALDDVLIGRDPEDYRVALILKLNGSYSGFHASEVWDWLEKSRVTE